MIWKYTIHGWMLWECQKLLKQHVQKHTHTQHERERRRFQMIPTELIWIYTGIDTGQPFPKGTRNKNSV